MSRQRAVQQFVAAGLALLILAVAAWALVSAYMYYNAELALAQTMKQRLSGAKTTDISDSELSLLEWGPGAPSLIQGDNPSLSGAELHGFVRRVFERHGGRIERVEVLPPSDAGFLEQISLSVTASTDIAGLSGFLAEIETGVPLTFIDELSVRVSAANEAAGALLDPLDVELELHAYRYKRAGP